MPLLILLSLLLLPGCGHLKAGAATVSRDDARDERPDSTTRSMHAWQPDGYSPSGCGPNAGVLEETGTAAVTPEPDQALQESAQPLSKKGTAKLNIQFDTGSHVIREADFDQLAEFARVMKSHPEICVVIEGHTDTVGSEESNAELSRQRAESVKSRLASEGIDPSRITVRGHGSSMPIADNGTEEGRRKNRRAQAEIEYEKSVFLKKKAGSTPLSSP